MVISNYYVYMYQKIFTKTNAILSCSNYLVVFYMCCFFDDIFMLMVKKQKMIRPDRARKSTRRERLTNIERSQSPVLSQEDSQSQGDETSNRPLEEENTSQIQTHRHHSNLDQTQRSQSQNTNVSNIVPTDHSQPGRPYREHELNPRMTNDEVWKSTNCPYCGKERPKESGNYKKHCNTHLLHDHIQTDKASIHRNQTFQQTHRPHIEESPEYRKSKSARSKQSKKDKKKGKPNTKALKLLKDILGNESSSNDVQSLSEEDSVMQDIMRETRGNEEMLDDSFQESVTPASRKRNRQGDTRNPAQVTSSNLQSHQLPTQTPQYARKTGLSVLDFKTYQENNTKQVNTLNDNLTKLVTQNKELLKEQKGINKNIESIKTEQTKNNEDMKNKIDAQGTMIRKLVEALIAKESCEQEEEEQGQQRKDDDSDSEVELHEKSRGRNTQVTDQSHTRNSTEELSDQRPELESDEIGEQIDETQVTPSTGTRKSSRITNRLSYREGRGSKHNHGDLKLVETEEVWSDTDSEGYVKIKENKNQLFWGDQGVEKTSYQEWKAKEKKIRVIHSINVGGEKGVVAEEDIKKNDIIVEYLGEMQMKDMDEASKYCFEVVTETAFLDAGTMGGHARFINSSFYNKKYTNCTVDTPQFQDVGVKIFIKATKDIEEGTELFYEYPFIRKGSKAKCGLK